MSAQDDLNNQYEAFKSLYESDPEKAIIESQNLILKITRFNSNREFAEYYREHGQTSSCSEESSSYCISISCLDCSLDSGIFLCLDCFYNGNHQGHKSIVFADIYGSCDCGDPIQMKRQGFCTKHKGLPDDDQIPNNLSEEFTKILTDVIFKAAISSLTKYSQSETRKSRQIFEFLTSFLQFGDIFRRLLSISLTEKIDFKKLISNVTKYNSEFNELLQTFCGKFVNDSIFIQNFSKVGFDLILNDILEKQIMITANHSFWSNIECWNYFWFQCFSKKSFQINIIQKKWNWVSFVVTFSKKLKKHFSFEVAVIYDMFPYYKDIIACFPYAAKIQPNEEVQILFDRFFNEILNCEVTDETVVPVSFLDKGNDYLKSILLFNTSFYGFFNCFKYKTNLKFDSFFNQLEKLIDINSIYCVDKKNKFALKFLNDNNNITYPSYYYLSYHNGASFFYSNPIYDSLVALFGLENICRIKIARFLSLEKCQSLRFKLLIITLKKLLSFVAYQADIVRKSNSDLYEIIGFIANSTNRISFGFPLFFPLFQLTVGLKTMNDRDEFSLKEFVAFETARLLGIFDDFSKKEYENEIIDEKMNDMIFSFLYFMILIVVERTLFNYDNNEFIKEQLIYAIKSGYDKMSKLQFFCDDKVLDSVAFPLIFNECLIEIATIQRCNSNRDNFLSKPEDTLNIKLKNGVKWKPFSAVVPFSYSKGIMNNIISKNPSDLIEVQDFKQEEKYFFNTPLFSKFSLSTFSLEFSHPEEEVKLDYEGLNIKLKDLLFTPTVLAISYHSLRKNSELVHINDHLSMNILILISKFVNENDFETTKKFDEKTIIHYNSICDLISQMKILFFNENSDETIENTLNINNFKKLLKIKFVFSDLQPKSFIELLIEKGELGKKVIFILKNNLDLDLDEIDEIKTSKEDDDDMKKKQKMKANEIKSKIMNNFNQKISDFTFNKSIESDDDDDQKKAELCSICSSEKENESLSYQIHIYPTKFPFIVDKPPELKEGENIGDSVEVSCDDDIEYDEDQEDQDLNILYENEEEEEYDTENNRRIFESIVRKIRNKESHEKVKNDDDENHVKRYTAGANFVLQFGICQHQLHPSCVHSSNFNCPIDRTSKNGFLPCLDSITTQTKLSENDKNSIELFLNVFKSFIVKKSDQQIDIFVELIKSISGLIVTNEIRLRNLPECLDSKKNKILARNLFLATWHAYRIHGKPKMENKRPYSKLVFNDDVELRLTEFQKFIKKLIECDEIESKSSSIQKIVSFLLKSKVSIDSQRNEKEICLFLRRVCLAEYFLLNIKKSDNDFVDWNEILNVQNLSKSYGVKFISEKFEFKPFLFKKLPYEFLRLSQKPYRLPLTTTTKYKTYNLFDFNDLIKNYDDLSDCYDEIDENKEKKKVLEFKMNDFFLQLAVNYGKKNYPSVLIQIGQNTSDVFIFYQNSIAFMDSIYLDENGLPDVGFFRHQPIFLDNERYKKFTDEILSGEFTDYSHSIFDFMS